MNKPVLIVQYPGFGASEVVNMSAVAAAEAARRQGVRPPQAPAKKEPVSVG